MEENFGCAVIVINKDSKVLLGKRKNSYKAGYYGLPGGRVDSQEKLIDATKRELFEETGLEANQLEFVGTVREWQETHTFIHFIYVCRDWRGGVELKEPDKCEAWEWVKLNNIPDDILSGHQQAIMLLQQGKIIGDI